MVLTHDVDSGESKMAVSIGFTSLNDMTNYK